mmetsp:Transcript_18941/g.31726  ORF Transcript_18941/g.31726 Transcript_18941/m.31726 type:complete len:236 (-) Transcript_18941:467-1174(-)
MAVEGDASDDEIVIEEVLTKLADSIIDPVSVQTVEAVKTEKAVEDVEEGTVEDLGDGDGEDDDDRQDTKQAAPTPGAFYIGVLEAAEEIQTLKQHHICSTLTVGRHPRFRQPNDTTHPDTKSIRNIVVRTARHKSSGDGYDDEEVERFVPQAMRFIDERMPLGGILVFAEEEDDEDAVGAIAAAWLWTRRDYSLAEAIHKVKKLRPSAEVSKVYEAQLKKIEAKAEIPAWFKMGW